MKKSVSNIRRLSDVKKVPEGEDKIILEDFYSEKVIFNYSDDVKKLIDFMKSEVELLDILGNNTDRDLTNIKIFLNPAEEDYKSFLEIDSFKFLIYLSRENIVSDLYLPLYMQEKTKIDGSKTYKVEWYPSIIYSGLGEIKSAIERHLFSGESMKAHIISFTIKDWVKFLKVIKKLEEKERKSKPTKELGKVKVSNAPLKVNYRDGVLLFQNKEIDFNKKDNQRDLLGTLFKEPTKNWFYDEIQSDWDDEWDGFDKNNLQTQKYWQKFYTAGDGINNAIAIETGIKDFIVKNTGTRGKIKINEKYL